MNRYELIRHICLNFGKEYNVAVKVCSGEQLQEIYVSIYDIESNQIISRRVPLMEIQNMQSSIGLEQFVKDHLRDMMNKLKGSGWEVR